LLLLPLLAGTACTANLSGPDLGELYSRAARQTDEFRNPIIVIPGVLGSRLEDRESDTVVWGAFAGNFAHPGRPDGARLLALPMSPGTPAAELGDAVVATEVLDRVRITLLRLPLEQKAYIHLLASLGAGGYRDQNLGLAGAIDYGSDHYTCFQFPYDWRLDNVENARRLHEFILEKHAFVQAEHERRFGTRREIKFDLVAHSMGGLLTRYYLRYGDAPLSDTGELAPPTWAGARHVERAVLVATPNAGSIDSLLNLVDGADFSWVLPEFPPAVLGTMPSLYQLLPRSRHGAVEDADGPLDLFDADVWQRLGWGLADDDQARVLARLLPEEPDPAERRRIALDHQRKLLARARRFHEAIDRPASPPAGLSLHLIAGDAELTPARVLATPDGALRVIEKAPGDGTVLRSSAVMDERVGRAWSPRLISPVDWTRVTFLFTDHLGLTRDPAFADNLLYVLLEEPRAAPGPGS